MGAEGEAGETEEEWEEARLAASSGPGPGLAPPSCSRSPSAGPFDACPCSPASTAICTPAKDAHGGGARLCGEKRHGCGKVHRWASYGRMRGGLAAPVVERGGLGLGRLQCKGR